MLPIYTYVIIYGVSIFIGVLTYSKHAHKTELKVFLGFLIYSFLTELLGAYLGRVLIVSNSYVYNVWNIVAFFFYAYFVLSKLTERKKIIFVWLLIGVFFIVTFINIVFYAGLIKYVLVNNSLLAKSLIVIMMIFYFIELLKSDEIINFKKSLFFWICTGVFFYNLAFLPAFALVKYTSYVGVFKYITFSLNIIMHLCFITGFIISKKEYN